MKEKANPKGNQPGEQTIPLQVRVAISTRGKLKAIASKNGLSLNDIATMCLVAGLPKVASKLDEINDPAAAAA